MKKLFLIIAIILAFTCCETFQAKVTENNNTNLLPPQAESGISVPYNFYERKDEFDGFHIVELIDNALVGEGRCCEACSEFKGISAFSFGLRKYTGKDKIIGYFVVLRYESSKWFFIEGGESLKIIADNIKMNFEGEGSIQNRDILHGGRVKETACYPITKKQIQQLVNAKAIKIKVQGRPYYDTACFLPDNIANMKRFYDEQIIK